jgi:hypothetical protein
MTLEIFWTDFRGEKTTQMSNVMELGSVGGELFHADGRTDGHEADSRCSQFCENVYKFLPQPTVEPQ